MATSLNLFARTIGGAVGVAIMGAILAAGLGGSARLGPAAIEVNGLAGISPELRQRLIASLQHAFTSGAVAAGLAVVVSFWVPPFAGAVQPSGEEMFVAEMAGLEPDVESVGVND